MNAGGVPNTCKSNEAPFEILRMIAALPKGALVEIECIAVR